MKKKARNVKVITQERLHAGIDAAVRKFQGIVQRHETPGQRVGAVYDYVKKHGPCTYRDITHLLSGNNLHANGRLRYLEEQGWLKCIGKSEPVNRGVYGCLPWGARLYVTTENRSENGYIVHAREKLYDRVDHLLQLGEQVPTCLAGRFDELTGLGWHPDRNLAIVDARLEGYTLEEIGKKFGMTRERVRQITHRALKF